MQAPKRTKVEPPPDTIRPPPIQTFADLQPSPDTLTAIGSKRVLTNVGEKVLVRKRDIPTNDVYKHEFGLLGEAVQSHHGVRLTSRDLRDLKQLNLVSDEQFKKQHSTDMELEGVLQRYQEVKRRNRKRRSQAMKGNDEAETTAEEAERRMRMHELRLRMKAVRLKKKKGENACATAGGAACCVSHDDITPHIFVFLLYAQFSSRYA